MEYPKVLHFDGDPHAEHVIVHSLRAETALRRAGYRMAYEPQQEKRKKADQ